MLTQSTILLVCAGVLLLVGPAQAFPMYFRDRHDASCTQHPTVGYGAHGAPIEGSANNSLSLRDPKGNAVTEYCGGETYTVEAEFGEESRSYLSSSYGTFAEAERNADSDCPNRVLDGPNDAPVASKNFTLSIPCDENKENITIRMTAASGATAPYLLTTSTIPRNSSCSSCPPPSSDPNTSPPPSSDPNNKSGNAADFPRVSLAVVAVVSCMALLAGL
ncbi:hypothetical protein DUNSADRAFT_14521 [Dunaliella salina]|uniref:Uncharacterized protein n=1 Tax=Dunaliella salina TaxID=3046 RepID=A0ABQ7G7B0_DUNSA|nr:hypothetical protein DUNSADRAFT_14521 [Dunaliella salina]|eukprot:KAF5830480.1 hypothetical protein DUNSADRAFT_14521 [Dunaliella salina]